MGIILVTGTSRGIGLELTKYYAAQGKQVVAVCRTCSPELKATGVEVIESIDLTSKSDVTRLAEQLNGRTISILINNAGVFGESTLGEIDFADVESQFRANAIAPLQVTEALLGNLEKGSKVAFITSRMASITDNTSGGYYAYRMSKAALNAAGVSLARDLLPRGVSVALLHPGFVQTQMVGFAGDISPATSAARLAERIAELTLETSGGFWHSNGEHLPW